MVQPVYPDLAKADQLDGDVVMKVSIAADGTVHNIRVTHGLPQLINSAVHAVSQWEYEPYRVNGVATPVDTTVTVSFKFASRALIPNGPPPIVVALSGAVGAAAKPALPPAPAGVLRISGRVMDSMLQKRVDPVYPADSTASAAQGTVVLLASIDKTGTVTDVQIVSGPTRFRDAATEAVKQWRYSPYAVDGEPADVQTTITLSFAPLH
jgi:TonB family protein